MEQKNNAAIRRIIKEVLSVVKPTDEEVKHAIQQANLLMGRLRAAAPKSVEIIMAGSAARGTQTRGNSDIDIFLLFPKTSNERSAEAKGLEIAKSIVDKKRGESFEIRYAEHPYLKLFMKNEGISADIVPAFKITDSSERVSAVDRTQLHNIFVNSRLTQEQKDEVRVLKSFMRFHNVYGAEARTQGFSGYLCELLIAHYGSFVSVLKAFAESKPPIVISFDRKENQGDAVRKFGSSLIVIDPTDKNRNVAAAVSRESLSHFALASRKFLSKPSIEYFYGRQYSDKEASSRLMELNSRMRTDLYSISVKLPDISEEILWQQISKLDAALRKELSNNGFEVVLHLKEVSGGQGALAYFINSSKRGSHEVKGPSYVMKENFEAFELAHRQALAFFIEEDHAVAIEPVKLQTPYSAIEWLLKHGGIQLPSYIKKGNIKISKGKPGEAIAKLLYSDYMRLTYI
ncbi:MAG: CCA tRNA nucleotidyltransferase [Candidatus Micrarchaeaceae archaeon]